MIVLAVAAFVAVAAGVAVWLYRRYKQDQAQVVAAHRAAITPAAWAAASWWSNILTDILNNTDPYTGTSEDERRHGLSTGAINVFRQTLSTYIVGAYLEAVPVYRDPHVTIDGNLSDKALTTASEAAGIFPLLLPRVSMVEVRPGELRIMRRPGNWETVLVD